MSKKYKKQLIAPDPVYQSVDLAKFVNQIMRKGKKSRARRIVYDAFAILQEKEKKEPLTVFERALENVTPQMEVRSKRVGGATYQVPIQVNAERGLALAMRWIIQTAKSGKGKPMKEKLAQELISAANKTGEAVRKKENIHRMAQANRAFAHLAW